MERKFTKILILLQLFVALFVQSDCGGLEEMYRWRQITFDQLQENGTNSSSLKNKFHSKCTNLAVN